MAQEHHRPEHGHGHNDTEHRLRRIEESVGRIEKSVGLQQAAAERIERKMATLSEQLDTIKADLDAATTKLGGDLDILIADFKSAGNLTPAQQAKLDAFSDVATALKDLDDKTVAAVAVEPPVTPPTP